MNPNIEKPRDEDVVRKLKSLEHQADQAKAVVGHNQCLRETARTRLEYLIASKQREAAELQALADALPARLPPQADEALWRLLGAYR